VSSAVAVKYSARQSFAVSDSNHGVQGKVSSGKMIWVDFENSPHVPFFKPIIGELEKRGYRVMLTARDCSQVFELADMFHLNYKPIGRHYGKNTLAKIAGLGVRMLQMTPTVLRQRPDLAISHGSRSLFVLSSLLGIPTITMFDYEHAKWASFSRKAWAMIPEVLPEQGIAGRGIRKDRILKYPGIKEDVYAPFFKPDSAIKTQLGLRDNDIIVTLRPPATEAHYHNRESEILLEAVFNVVRQQSNTRVVLLPRTEGQERELRKSWAGLFAERKVIVPVHVVDGMDLIWFSDLVISGGGTMNREAAALGVPVYSIFRGKIGAVDQYLADSGRLRLLKTVEDVHNCIAFEKRPQHTNASHSSQSYATLNVVVDNIVRVLESA
jgi:predicted glycosyltransferase